MVKGAELATDRRIKYRRKRCSQAGRFGNSQPDQEQVAGRGVVGQVGSATVRQIR